MTPIKDFKCSKITLAFNLLNIYCLLLETIREFSRNSDYFICLLSLLSFAQDQLSFRIKMNFFNHFSELWNSRFPDCSQPPQLDCLKADQFCTLLDQKQAIELEESKICAVLEDLKSQLARESFIAEFLHKCIQKLGAVSQVFNEIDQCDSKSSSSSGTTGRHPGSLSSPGLSVNGSGIVPQNKGAITTSGSQFSLFPQCITSSLIHSASPLLAAAAATSTTPFLLSSTLSNFPCPESIKLDPESESLTGLSSNFLLSAVDRPSYGNLPRLNSHSSFYNNCSTSNPFHSSTSSFTHNVNSSLHAPTPFNGTTGSSRGGLSEDIPTSEAHAAAAAVAAAFGLGLSSVRSIGSNQPFNQTGHGVNFGRPENVLPSSISNVSTLHETGNNTVNPITSVTHSNVTSVPTSLNDHPNDTLDPNASERPYRCGTCSRSFAVKAGLVQHMRTHTDERPYPCMHCGRAFKQKIQLTTHMRVHSGERPYGCRLCGKLFRQQSHVVQHLRTHTGEKPHKCYQCGKAFRQKYSLISHQRRMCRNRAASNPIAAGMTMWISPGLGGDTCNLVKEFSPTKCHLTSPISTNTSPSSTATISVTNAASIHSPFSPFLSSPSVSTTTVAPSTTASSGLPSHTQFPSSPVHQPPPAHPDDAHLISPRERTRTPVAYRHRGDRVAPAPDPHLPRLSSEVEEVDEQIRSPHTNRINTSPALGLS